MAVWGRGHWCDPHRHSAEVEWDAQFLLKINKKQLFNSSFCFSHPQVLFAAMLVHPVPSLSHVRCASTQVSAAAPCCPALVLQAERPQRSMHFKTRYVFVLNRPLWVEFQKEQSTFAVDNQYMIGDKIIFYIFLSSLCFLYQRVLYFC